jgi:hypothetical protein
VPLGRLFDCLIISCWIAVGAAAPEFIWRGLAILVAHLTLQEVYSVILIGMLLAFFVEPLMERMRTGRWAPRHHDARELVLTAAIAFGFGVVTVAIHEAMNAYLGGGGGPAHDKQANLFRAMRQVQEWASIPFAVTIAWFAARMGGRAAAVAGIIACVWVVAIGVYYEWEWRDSVRTSIPCFAIIAVGEKLAAGRWDGATFRLLAVRTAAIAASWFVLLWLAQATAALIGPADLRLYTWSEFVEDFLFYLGWSLGLAVAPNPAEVWDRARSDPK